ncbi:40S ribosomal protein mrp2, mitochondrial [Malassezia japonica]|uniref:40S ribosomal protein mrp2, mitochondrial n=1 Tax=Malassezia japonica TaxID=223818 RepID=A0AAF0F3F0_9BASI|nr:40S ribosomal protein mrp2, mitochondrial [Malassezia japonica]WFD39872.1 40S ribosomal protein mrp2, mitochondrial [Malassezia japonica]
MAARHAVHSNELLRRAYKYIARNTTLPPRVRHMAQLELNTFPNRSRPATVKERCTETGRGRGILTDFGLCRYQFRQKALAGDLPGVEKASW